MNDRSAQFLGETLRSALHTVWDPSRAAADWLAREIDPGCAGAVALLTSRATTMAHLQEAKDAFKTMRVVGETGSDRILGGRLYAAAIAAGIVHHGERISRQSDAALRRALEELHDDPHAAAELRALAGSALARLTVE
jgi:hypothetical protein